MNDVDYANYFWQGEKVRLRPLRVEDAEQSYIDSLDSPSRRLLQLGIELPTSTKALREFMARYADCKDVDGVIVFAIETHEGVDVGGMSLHSRSQKNGTFGFGISIGAPHRRKGYATDAVRILLRYCFLERRYQKCNSACVHTNAASIKLHEKLGFVREGRRRRQWFLDGQYYDDLLFGLTREEFDQSENGYPRTAHCTLQE
jgi:RimJ/RimL family protein N-acetyltransferase